MATFYNGPITNQYNMERQYKHIHAWHTIDSKNNSNNIK